MRIRELEVNLRTEPGEEPGTWHNQLGAVSIEELTDGHLKNIFYHLARNLRFYPKAGIQELVGEIEANLLPLLRQRHPENFDLLIQEARKRFDITHQGTTIPLLSMKMLDEGQFRKPFYAPLQPDETTNCLNPHIGDNWNRGVYILNEAPKLVKKCLECELTNHEGLTITYNGELITSEQVQPQYQKGDVVAMERRKERY